jgi:hypothetical protein
MMAIFVSGRIGLSKIGEANPRLSKAGMPSRNEGWGGLFKVEQYRLIRSASRASIRWLQGGFAAFPNTSLSYRWVRNP